MSCNEQLFKEGFVMKKWRDNAKGPMQYTFICIIKPGRLSGRERNIVHFEFEPRSPII